MTFKVLYDKYYWYYGAKYFTLYQRKKTKKSEHMGQNILLCFRVKKPQKSEHLTQISKPF